MKLRFKFGDTVPLIRSLRRMLVTRGIPSAIEKLAEKNRKRTDRSVDVEGKRFKPYAKATKRRRKKLGLTTARVTLKETGDMMASLGKKTKKGHVLTVAEAQKPKAKGNQYHRTFIGVNEKEDIPDMQQAIAKEWRG